MPRVLSECHSKPSMVSPPLIPRFWGAAREGVGTEGGTETRTQGESLML